MRRAVGLAGVVMALMLLGAAPSLAQSITLNRSNQSNVDMVTLRGFDPTTITGPSDPRPDTSNPFAGIVKAVAIRVSVYHSGDKELSGASAEIVDKINRIPRLA